ncbi:MAG: calcium-binding protein [Candidatus Aerophobetes bacterium]|nr:calcium-binding protein [Candidatus Aerophobetes bacterium]
MVEAIPDYMPGGDKYDDADQATKDAAQQFTNRVEVSDYTAATVETHSADYATETSFYHATTNPTGELTVDETAASVTTAKATVDSDNPDTGDAFELTTDTDSFVGTELNDLFTSANGTLAAADTILDSSVTDSDIMNIETTSNAGVSARIQNIETINANGTYVSVGYDATTTSGTENLNVSTSIVGGTANVTGASSINVANINAGTNIATLNVTSVAGGTRDTVNVDGGSASAVKLVGNANGIDKFDVTIADGATLTVNDAGTLGEYTANVGSTATITAGTGTGIKAFTVNAAEDSAVTISSLLSATAANLGNTDFSGAGNVTVTAAKASLDNQAMTSTGTGTLEVVVSDAVAAENLENIQADTLTLKGKTNAVTVNDSSVINLFDTGLAAIAVNNAAATIDVNSDGAYDAGDTTAVLNVKVSDNQTELTAGNHVSTLLLEATPDEAADTDGTDGTAITLTSLVTSAQTETVVVSGAADLTITDVTDGADLVITATEMTGKLNVGATDANVNDLTVVAGINDDTVAINIAGTKTGIVLAGAGDDTLSATGAGTATIKLYGEAGDDTITGAAGNDTITGGTGNDTINGAGGADEITTGTGTDSVIIEDGEAGDTITDAVVAEDTIILRGASNAGAALDLTDMTATAAALYDEFGTDHEFTLTGFAAVTDLSTLVQLGDATEAYEAEADFDLVASANNDTITTAAAGTSGDVDLGAGDDKITTGAAVTGDITGGAGADTYSLGHDANIVDLASEDILLVTDIGLAVVAGVASDLTATADSISAATGAGEVVLNLADGVDVDMTLATITGTVGYTINTATVAVDGADAVLGSTIVGSRSADIIIGSDADDTITGGEGADEITVGEGMDTVILTESVSSADEVTLAVNSTDTLDNIDVIVDARFDGAAGIDTIVTGITQATSADLYDLATNDYDTSNATLALAVAAAHVDAVTASNSANADSDGETDILAGDAFVFEYADKTYLVQESTGNSTTFAVADDLIVEITGFAGTIDMVDITA